MDADRVARLLEQIIGGGLKLAPDTELFELDGFTSLVVVDLTERLEYELGREIPAELIAPETFSSSSAIADAIADLSAGSATR